MKKTDGSLTEEQKKAKIKKPTVWGRIKRMCLMLLGIGILCYGGLVGYVYYAETHVPPPDDFDSIIVLGAQVLPDGTPSVQLDWRLDKALEMYRIRPCPIVVCGGQGANEPRPEGEVMMDRLLADGVPQEHIYAEITSQNTKENIRNAWEILEAQGCERPLIVTSDYHLPRALAIARDVGLVPQGAGSLCRNEVPFWIKNHFREALAWVKYWGIKYAGLPL